ncbi:Protein of unknown function [Gryllus bimaculatus]|nr:Protein of unknown function [Gryllus bimaculatus]
MERRVGGRTVRLHRSTPNIHLYREKELYAPRVAQALLCRARGRNARGRAAGRAGPRVVSWARGGEVRGGADGALSGGDRVGPGRRGRGRSCTLSAHASRELPIANWSRVKLRSRGTRTLATRLRTAPSAHGATEAEPFTPRWYGDLKERIKLFSSKQSLFHGSMPSAADSDSSSNSTSSTEAPTTTPASASADASPSTPTAEAAPTASSSTAAAAVEGGPTEAADNKTTEAPLAAGARDGSGRAFGLDSGAGADNATVEKGSLQDLSLDDIDMTMFMTTEPANETPCAIY